MPLHFSLTAFPCTVVTDDVVEIDAEGNEEDEPERVAGR